MEPPQNEYIGAAFGHMQGLQSSLELDLEDLYQF